MRHAVWLGFVTISFCSAQSYTLQDVCAPLPCNFASLNHSGSGTGHLPTRPGATFVYTPQAGFITLPIVGDALDVNESGDVVGDIVASQTYAFVSVPPYTQFNGLSTIFGWTFGYAASINDYGDIVGTGMPPNYPFFPGITVEVLTHINNLRQITGAYLDSNNTTQYFLYTPGSGMTLLTGPATALSDTGHVLTSDSSGSYIYTPTGNIRLPTGFRWNGLNDTDEVVGGNPFIEGTFLYSPTGGLVEISNSVTNGAGWTFGGASFLANNGVIVAQVVNPQGQETDVLLMPVALPAVRLQNRAARDEKPREYTLNGLPVR